MYRMMLEAGARTHDLSSVRLWASGADTLPADVVHEFQHLGAAFRLPTRARSLGRATFVDGYGMVELGGGVAFRVFPPLRLPGAGLMRCLPRHPLRIVDPEGNDVARGEIGEIAVAARGRVLGYHRRPEATAELFTRDGLVRTGDLARAYRLGFFELLGRKKDVIKHGGFSVFSVEVERVLETHPAVAEAAVIGWPHDTKGEVPVAAVRTNPGTPLTPEALRQFASERLSDYKVPQRVFLRDELPHTGTGKVNKPLLKQQLHARDAEPVA
jgi:acyl-CoA synthetase (AMP-forming)/AMP-acid ligase II